MLLIVGVLFLLLSLQVLTMINRRGQGKAQFMNNPLLLKRFFFWGKVGFVLHGLLLS